MKCTSRQTPPGPPSHHHALPATEDPTPKGPSLLHTHPGRPKPVGSGSLTPTSDVPAPPRVAPSIDRPSCRLCCVATRRASSLVLPGPFSACSTSRRASAKKEAAVRLRLEPQPPTQSRARRPSEGAAPERCGGRRRRRRRRRWRRRWARALFVAHAATGCAHGGVRAPEWRVAGGEGLAALQRRRRRGDAAPISGDGRRRRRRRRWRRRRARALFVAHRRDGRARGVRAARGESWAAGLTVW